MSPIDPDDLIDSSQVAQALGLTHRHSVSTYRRRYADFPRPALTRGKGRTNLWLRSDVEAWRSPSRASGGGPSAVDRKREAIIDAAAELMATRPITDISVREIARRAAVPHTDRAPVIALFLASLHSDIETRRAAGTPQPTPVFPTLTPELAVGAVAALVVGWAAFEPRIMVGTGLTETPSTELAALATAILDLARP